MEIQLLDSSTRNENVGKLPIPVFWKFFYYLQNEINSNDIPQMDFALLMIFHYP